MPRRRDQRPAPSLGEAFYDLKSEFRMGTDSRFHSRLKGVDPSGSGADYHYRSERQWLHMLERARFYRRDDQVIAPAVRRLVANVVQDGFTLDVQTGDDELNLALKDRWYAWAGDRDQCHSEGELTFQQMERMAFDAVITDGDLFLLPLKSGAVQPVEAHRVRTPSGSSRKNLVHGVLVAEGSARRQEYWITKEDLGLDGALRRVQDVTKVPVRDKDGRRQVLHLYDPVRFSQRRGVTAFAPISFTAGGFDDLQFASLVKQQIGAFITLLRTRDQNFAPDGADGAIGERTEEYAQGFIRVLEGIGAGLDIGGQPGEKLEMFASNVPGPGFREHSLLLLTFVAINLDLPLAVLLLDPSETNFSGWRGAIDQARMRFKQLQQWLIGVMHTPLYEWKVRQWLATDAELLALAERPGVLPFAHCWNPPRWSYIEPHKDAAAAELQHKQLLAPMRLLQADLGRDWDEVSTQIVEDNAMIIRKAIQARNLITQEFPGETLDWREILRLPTADTVSGALALGDPAPAAAPKPAA